MKWFYYIFNNCNTIPPINLVLILGKLPLKEYSYDFSDQNPLLITQICNKCQNMLKRLYIHTTNKKTHIFTIVSQIKGILTQEVFSMCPNTFAPPFYTTYIQHTHLIFGLHLDPLSYSNYKFQVCTCILYPPRTQNEF